MSEGMPNEVNLGLFYAPAPMSEHFYSVIDDKTMMTPINQAKYHHDDKYRAAVKSASQHLKLCSDLKAEAEKLREENERLKTAIAEAKIVQYAVEG